MTDPAATPETADSARDAARSLARKTWLARLAIAVVTIAAAVGIWYLIFARNYANTDNAYVNAEMAQITPLVSTSAVAVHVKDTQFVRRGTVLVEQDTANLRIALAAAEADLAAARRRFRQALATTGALSAQVSARGADIARAEAQLAAARGRCRFLWPDGTERHDCQRDHHEGHGQPLQGHGPGH